MKYEFMIKLKTPTEVAIVCKNAEKYETPIDIRSRDNHYVVDALSIIGVLSLNLSNPVIVSTENESVYNTFKEDIKEFIVKE